MPLTLEPGCIVRRNASTGTGAMKRHMIVTKVFPAMGFAECAYIRRNREYGYKFRRIAISRLTVLLNAPERISSEALAAGQADPYAGINPGQSGH